MGKPVLLPCPFCGQSDLLVERLDNSASVVICQGLVDEHSACLARGPVGVQDDNGEDQPGYAAAVREWNKRGLQPASVAVPDCDICHGTRRVKEPGCDEGDCARCLSAGPHPVSGEQKPPTVQITGHLDEVDAPVWEFINAQARQLGPATGSIDTYNFARPNGAQPNGVVVVLWNGNSIHAMAVTVRDSMNRTQCVRLLTAPPAAQGVAGLALIEAGNPLSNVAYNLAQRPGHVLTSYDCELMAELRQRWDAALAAHSAQQAEKGE